MSYRESESSGSSCRGSESEGSGSEESEGEISYGSGNPGSDIPELPFPGFPAVALRYLTQDTKPRSWCLKLITNPWFERVSMLVILLNCVTLGMYQPCVDDKCVNNRCKILTVFDDLIFAFFTLEMSIKMVAMGIYGRETYLADSWNRLDFFIVLAGALEYCLHVENMNLSAIRTIRVLRPLRAINRIPSMRILVMLLLDTLPMLGNVLLLCFFVFFIFGIVGVQLWEGILRQRCELVLPPNVYRPNISFYYEFSKEQDYICTTPEDSGMHTCGNFPPYRIGPLVCNETAKPNSLNLPTSTSCVNWNQYYTNCTARGSNPFQGTISFDNIGLAWVAIFLVISLEGWTDIMYYVQDAHSFWDWIYFVLLIVIGSFFMINLCLVVIATQFSETKKREMERMRAERLRFTSSSTLASSTNNSEPTTCYAEMVKYVAHLWRRFRRRMLKRIRLYRYERARCKASREALHLSTPARKTHHPACPKKNKESQLEKVVEVVHLELPSPPMASDTRAGLLRVPSVKEQDLDSCASLSLLSAGTLARRRSSVMFCDTVLLHAPHNVAHSEKMTQTELDLPAGDTAAQAPPTSSSSMSCQELLALSGALSAALPTGQVALDTFFEELTKGITKRTGDIIDRNDLKSLAEDFTCCAELQFCELGSGDMSRRKQRSRACRMTLACGRSVNGFFSNIRNRVKDLVNHKYFQQGILLAILINTLSMGIEYHNQPEELTVIVEISNVIFSAVFAVEMLLKVISEGPFKYIANGFNVFDGVIVILGALELTQSMSDERDMAGGSGLSVLRTFRLLRILKLVRFMPNLRRQLFVMLRTMDNVAVFFSLLVLFIFIFSILGMYLFGGKFCKYVEDSGIERECTCPEIVSHEPRCECDRKHFNNILWATVTVFQILTQEDWNVVLFNGMEKTSHWAALYFVALMTFGNYVLFNLLVAILVEGFSSERNERREREQRELAKSKLSSDYFSENFDHFEGDRSESSDSFSNIEIKNQWRSADDVRKAKARNERKGKLATKRPRQLDRYGSRSSERKRQKTHEKGVCLVEFNENIKCNLQKASAMMTADKSVPTITHTAATPQDSPSPTLLASDPSDMHFPDLLSSLDSIDRSSCSSFQNSLKPPNSYSLTLHSVNFKLHSEKARLPPISISIQSPPASPQPFSPRFPEKSFKISTGSDDESEKSISQHGNSEKCALFSNPNLSSSADDPKSQDIKCRVHRGYSWKISRSSLRRASKNKCRTASESDAIIILNNGREHSHINGSDSKRQEKRKNDLLQSSNLIKNDTQSDSNNARSKGLSPQNSLKGVSTHSSIKSRMASSVLLPDVSWQVSENLSVNSRLSTQKISIEGELLPAAACSDSSGGKQCNLVICAHKSQSPPMLKMTNEEMQKTNNLDVTNESNELNTRPLWKRMFSFMEPTGHLKDREDYALYIFPPNYWLRRCCTWLVERKWFDNVVLLFIGLNCITLAMERPNIPPNSTERFFLATANYVFTLVFAVEMFLKVIATGMFYGTDAYFTSGWNIMDGSLVIISIIDLLMSVVSESSPRIFGILRVFRLLRSLRPLRVINRAPGLKLVVQTLLSSLRPIGNIVLICCTFFIIFGILGVQLFKGAFYFCEGINLKNVKNKTDCLSIEGNVWVNRKYNFDDLGKALMSLFVLSSRDGWVNIMYTGLDAVGVDQQPIRNYSEWRLLYFIAFILLVGFFVLNMFVGVVVENFHRCREEQEKEERVRRAAKRALQMEKKRRKMHQPPYYAKYGETRLFVHNVVTSKYFDLAIAGVIGLNVVTMAIEYYRMPPALEYALKIFNYFFTAVFILEAIMKLYALGIKIYMKDKWNQLDVMIVKLSIVGIVLEELQSNIIPINPTIMRVMRVLRIARVLKLLKMAKGIRALLDTVMQALPQVGNLGLLFFLLFFIFAALGVELFGRLECSDEIPCQGLGEHAHFANFGMAFLTLFRVATGDNWNGIMKDTLREECDNSVDCVRNCCVSSVIAPIFFVIFVLMAQFVLVNVVVAVLMKHLEESHKQMEDEMDMEVELEREMEREQEEQEERALCSALDAPRSTLSKAPSLPDSFTYEEPPTLSLTTILSQRRKTLQSPRPLLPLVSPSRRSSLSPNLRRRASELTPEFRFRKNFVTNRRPSFDESPVIEEGVMLLPRHEPFNIETRSQKSPTEEEKIRKIIAERRKIETAAKSDDFKDDTGIS